MEAIAAAGLVAARFLHYAATTLAFGAALFPLYGLPGAEPPARLRRLLAGLCVGSAAMALASGLLWLGLATAGMAGSPDAALDPAALTLVIRETEFGQVWLGRLVLAGLLLGLVLARPDLPVAALPAGALLATIALTGHPRAHGLVLIAADAVHLLAAGAWLGALAPLLLLAGGRRAGDDLDTAGLARLLARFSGAATAAVALLAATGLVGAFFLVGRPEALATSLYGQVLAAKLVLFAAMLALAAANRFWITAALAKGPADPRPWLARLRRHIVAEQALGAGVLALVAFLGTLAPPTSG